MSFATATSLLLLAACAGGSPPASPAGAKHPGAAAVAPDFTGRDLGGRTFRLSDHLGEVVLLDFFSTFCEPCKAEFPHLGAMYESDRKNGLLVVAVSMDGPETVADVPSFVKRFELPFPVVIDEDSRIASLYNPKKSMPLSVLIDRSGRVVAVREGYNPGDEKLVLIDVQAALAKAAR